MGCGGSKRNPKTEIKPKPSLRTKPVLGYWNCHGRGDPCRMLLHNIGIEFEDKQYKFGETAGPASWPANKSNMGMVFPNLPYYKDEDIIHAETLPVLRAICRKYKPQYMGRSIKELSLADSYASTIYESLLLWFEPYMFMSNYKEKKEEGLAKGREFRDLIAKCIGQKKFVAGDGVTYADFIAYNCLKRLQLYEPAICSENTVTSDYMNRMFALQGMKKAEESQGNLIYFSPSCAWQKDNMTKAKLIKEPSITKQNEDSAASVSQVAATVPASPEAPLIPPAPVTMQQPSKKFELTATEKVDAAVAAIPDVPTVTTPILGYWNVQARGDPCRMLLHNIGVNFEDKMYTFGDTSSADSWEQSKGKLGTAFPNLPYWHEGDHIHCETLSILRSICRRYCPDYLGRNATEQAYADSFCGTIYDGFPKWFAPYAFMPGYESKHGAGVEAGKAYLKQISHMIGKKKFVAGDGVTYADFMAYWILKIMAMYDAHIIGSNKKMHEYMRKMAELKGMDQAEIKYANLPSFATRCAWWNGKFLNDNALCFNFHIEILEGQEAEFREVAEEALDKVQWELTCLDYTWCFNGRNAMIRDAYMNADAFAEHMTNLGDTFAHIREHSKILEVEVTGSTEEWEKVKSKLEGLGAVFYAREFGFRRQTPNALGANSFFEVLPGKEAQLKDLIPLINSRVLTEEGTLDYTWCFNGNKVLLREAYADANAVNKHYETAADLLEKLMGFVKILKIDVTGNEDDLNKLKPMLDTRGAVYFFKEIGLSVA